MIEPERHDDPLDTLLRASAPQPLADDGFVLRTMSAIGPAERRVGTIARRPAPMAPITLARALVAERRRQAGRTRQWRWAMAGAIGGYLLMLVAMSVSPSGASIGVPSWDTWTPVALMMALGSIWVAWRELRADA